MVAYLPQWFLDEYTPLTSYRCNHLICRKVDYDILVLERGISDPYPCPVLRNPQPLEEEEKKRLLKLNSVCLKFNEGEIYDLKKLLFPRKRDYLIRSRASAQRQQSQASAHASAPRQQVEFDQLSGKYVLLYFVWLSKVDLCDPVFEAVLRQVYNEFSPLGMFEVVFVAIGNDQASFDSIFSKMPWLAIPHEDQIARLLEQFGVPRQPLLPKAALFDPCGKLLLENCVAKFRIYGVKGFPFTGQRLKEVEREDDELRRKELSLTRLLGSYVSTCRGRKVPTSSLTYKIVGLHFFELSWPGIERTSRLLEIWNSLENWQRKKFKIVLINADAVNLSLAKRIFGVDFSSLPWYLLPFDGRQLTRVFRVGPRGIEISEDAGYLIILEPERPQSLQSVSYFAFDILETYEIQAFPFTLEGAVKAEQSIQKKSLVLNCLFSPSAPLHKGVSNSEEVRSISELSGRCVLLLFATYSCYNSSRFLHALKSLYLENKERMYLDDGFEIIYISLDCTESPSSFLRCREEMPWFVHDYNLQFASALAKRVFFDSPLRLPAIAAFGPDGGLQTKETNLLFKKEWRSNFPFIQADMIEEVRREVVNRYNWNLKYVFPEISTN